MPGISRKTYSQDSFSNAFRIRLLIEREESMGGPAYTLLLCAFMSGLRIILCFVFALAFVVPPYLRGDDVICIEDTGRISIGCREVVDTAVHTPDNKTTTRSAPPCGPCSDIQINCSAAKDAPKFPAPAKAPLSTLVLPAQDFGLSTGGITAVSPDTGPLARPSDTTSSLRC